MSPEVANHKPYNHKAEVFSFATVLWEMLAHKRPFHDYLAYQLPKALLKGAKPTVTSSKKWSKELRVLLENMRNGASASAYDRNDISKHIQEMHLFLLATSSAAESVECGRC